MSIFNPSQHIYTTVIEDILSNSEIRIFFKPTNIVRYDTTTTMRFPFKADIAPADLPELILQLNGVTYNRHTPCGRLEQYDFQVTITTNAWNLGQSDIPHVLMQWLYDGNDNTNEAGARFCHLDWGENRRFFKCEVMPMQIANSMGTNRNLSGFVYAVYFNIQVDYARIRI